MSVSLTLAAVARARRFLLEKKLIQNAAPRSSTFKEMKREAATRSLEKRKRSELTRRSGVVKCGGGVRSPSARGAYATPVAHPLCVASWAPQEHSFFLINSGPSITSTCIFRSVEHKYCRHIAAAPKEGRRDEGPIYFYYGL